MATSPGNGVPASPTAVLNKLRSRGLRVSTPRRFVVKALFDAESPLTASEIAAGLEQNGAELDLATVYRNLETLEELEVIVRMQGGDGTRRWLLAETDQHDFVACHSCGSLESIEAAELDTLRAALRDRFGYEVGGFTRFPLVGLCPGCAAGRSGKSAP
jgi:Fur family transcriptional regulator, ferric uptake regulator